MIIKIISITNLIASNNKNLTQQKKLNLFFQDFEIQDKYF